MIIYYYLYIIIYYYIFCRYKNTLHAIKSIASQEGLRGIYKGYGATVASFGPLSAINFATYEFCKNQMIKWYGLSGVNIHNNHINNNNNNQLDINNNSKSKTHTNNTNNSPSELPLSALLLCGAVAGTFSSFITNPLDLVKLRIQIQRRQKYQMAHMLQANSPSLSTTNINTINNNIHSHFLENPFNFRYKNTLDGLIQVIKNEGFPALFRGATARMAFVAPSTAITISLVDILKGYYTRLLDG